MVDIIRFLPPISKTVPSDIPRIKNRPTSKQITLPILFSTATINYQNDRKNNNNHKKRSARRNNNTPSRQMGASDTSDGIYRKDIDQEMARYYPGTTIDMSASIKIKQQQQQQQYKNSNRESFKAIIGNGTTVSSIPILSNVDARSSRLFDTLSKHFTIKAEPLRPSNQFVNNTTSTLSSWKKYWTSTETQKQTNEFYDSDYFMNDFRYDQTLLSTKDYVTLYDVSSYTNSRTQRRNSSASLTRSNTSTAIHISSPITTDKQSYIINEESQHCLPQTIALNEESPLMDQPKIIKEKRSSVTSSNTVLNSDDHDLEDRINKITTKIYKFPLPSNKPKSSKSISKSDLLKPVGKSSRLSTRSADKKETSMISPNTFVTKRKRQKPVDRKLSNKSNQSTTKKHQYISTVTPTVLKSKYEQAKWDQPYVSTRNDPPTPPCSPSSVLNIGDHDQENNDVQESTNNISQ